MSQSIPLIRAASIAPMHRWLVEAGHDPAPFMTRAGLEWISTGDPLLPIPLSGAVRLLVDIARTDGPDTPWRIARGRGGYEIGFIGAAALMGPTVRAGFRRLSQSMPVHSTHEIFAVQTDGPGITINDGWTLNLGEDEVLHYVQQYVASLVDMICSEATGFPTSIATLGLVPHPSEGVSHLEPFLGERVGGRKDRLLDIAIDGQVADCLMPESVRERASEIADPTVPPLKLGNCLADDVVTLLASMLPRTKPSVDAVAAAADMSSRTFKRRLREEGKSFSGLVEGTRASMAIARLEEPAPPLLKDLATELGYANQETLTRAMRRWTGKPPRELTSSS
ncbi:AraC-type transcriptional regulator [Aliiruegeria haliotis]|uniref:AraC-type transcriptional regulator n=2 Tax=Aliiruegeria haliotis TaxID=1280846 RepID=A0A2T0RM21_9RHOB|nr:AraC-type transcriptional regulator [Aliiruegeria haliotis]